MKCCTNCGVEFEPTSNTQKYCSDACKPRRQVKTKPCEVCGREFGYTDKREKYCSDTCKRGGERFVTTFLSRNKRHIMLMSGVSLCGKHRTHEAFPSTLFRNVKCDDCLKIWIRRTGLNRYRADHPEGGDISQYRSIYWATLEEIAWAQSKL